MLWLWRQNVLFYILSSVITEINLFFNCFLYVHFHSVCWFFLSTSHIYFLFARLYFRLTSDQRPNWTLYHKTLLSFYVPTNKLQLSNISYGIRVYTLFIIGLICVGFKMPNNSNMISHPSHLSHLEQWLVIDALMTLDKITAVYKLLLLKQDWKLLKNELI